MTNSHESLVDKADTCLRLGERRDLEGASEYLADGATPTFPGDVKCPNLLETATESTRRYRKIRKDATTVVSGRCISDGLPIVVSMGTLDGVSPGWTPFKDVRYSDKFVIRDGPIVEQYVFNDPGEAGFSPRQPNVTAPGRRI